MVDAGKSKGNKGKESKISTKPAWLPEIDMMSLIVGAAIYAFFPILAYDRGIDALIAFGAAGPLLIGYQARSDIKAIILGVIGGTPLLYLANMGYLGAYKATETSDLLTAIIVLGLSAVMSWFGAHLYKNRAKAKEEYYKQTGGTTKNIPPKKEKRLQDTGSVKQNIINMFKPRRKQ